MKFSRLLFVAAMAINMGFALSARADGPMSSQPNAQLPGCIASGNHCGYIIGGVESGWLCTTCCSGSNNDYLVSCYDNHGKADCNYACH